MMFLMGKLGALLPILAQSDYEQGKAVGQIVGAIFGIAIAVWAYKKFAGGGSSGAKSKKPTKKRRRN